MLSVLQAVKLGENVIERLMRSGVLDLKTRSE